MTPARRANFQRLLKPRHIAFVGGRVAAIAVNEVLRALAVLGVIPMP